MSNNAVLGYLDLVWKERNPTSKDSYFGQKKSFTPDQPILASSPIPFPSTPTRGSLKHQASPDFYQHSPLQGNSPSSNELPIHTILLDLQDKEKTADAEFFAPFVAHHWQLQRLLNVLCCSTPVLSIAAAIRANNAKIKKFSEPSTKLAEKIKNLKEAIPKVTSQIDTLNDKIEDMDEASEDYANLKADIEKLELKLSALNAPDQIAKTQDEIKKLELAQDNLDNNEQRQSTITELKLIGRSLESKRLAILEEMQAGKRDEDVDNIQAALVVGRILNIVFRQGMSTPLLSDQLRLEKQLAEFRLILTECGIRFDVERFGATFFSHDSVMTKGTVLERLGSELSEDIAWLFGDPDPNELPADLSSNDEDEANANETRAYAATLAMLRYYVSRVLGIQALHAFYNNFRLGATRLRRHLAFLQPYLNNPTYSEYFEYWDPSMRAALRYVNWMFFVPRLSLNLSILAHHLCNTKRLESLESKLDISLRFRAHWARIWFEVFADTYWILIGLKVCFWLPGGALSPLGIALSVTVQFLDLFTSILRASVELYSLHKMYANLEKAGVSTDIKGQMNKRFWFEALFLGYMVFHFSILMIGLCLTLPAMGAVSTALPVVGSAVAVLMTAVTYCMQTYFTQKRQAEFEPGPEAAANPELPQRYSRYFA